MRSSWADSVANAEESAPATGAAPTPVANHQNSRPTRSAYVPPHLRGQAPTTTAAPAPAPGPAAVQPSASVQPSGYAAIVGGSRWAGPASGDGTGAVGGPRQSVGTPALGGTGETVNLTLLPIARQRKPQRLILIRQTLASTLMPMRTFLWKQVAMMCHRQSILSQRLIWVMR